MSFKLSYSSLRWQTPDLEKLLGEMAEAGWQGWELRQSFDWLGTPKRVREISNKAGCPVAVVCGTGISLEGDHAMKEKNRRRIEFAAEVEADCFMFMGAGKPKDREISEEDLAALAELSDEFADYASQYGLDVCYHIHTNTTVDSKEDWAKFMDEVELCKLCLDVSHSALWGYEPSESLKHYKDALIYVHLQDFKDPKWTELGEGNLLDFPASLKALDEIGYDRWVTTCPGESDRTDEEKMRVNREYLRNLGY